LIKRPVLFNNFFSRPYLGDRSRQSAKKLWDRPTRCLPTMRCCLHRLLGVL